MSNLPVRDEYRIKDFLNDLKKINPTPTIMYEIGSNLVYPELIACEESLGKKETVTLELKSLLEFMQNDYERDLLEGNISKAKDTPRAAINRFMRNRPEEFRDHKLQARSWRIRDILKRAEANRIQERQKLEAFVKSVRGMTEESPKDPEVWNKYRLLLWLTGKYNEASEAFKTAKKLGWNPESCNLVGI